MQEIQSIISRVARKFIGTDQEDLQQEIWVRLLKKDKILECDIPLIYVVVKRISIDIYREQKWLRDREIIVEDNNLTQQPYNTEFDEGLLTKGLLDMYPHGTKERKYLVLKLNNEGMLNNLKLSKEDQSYINQSYISKKKLVNESDYVRELGFSGPSAPGSWVVAKRVMKEKIKTYLQG